MTDAQYEAKFKEMQKYIPFIQKVIEKLKLNNDHQGDNPRKAQLQKMEMLHGLLTNRAKKLKMETLLKCEGVLIKLHAKIEKHSTFLQNEDPLLKSFDMPSSSVKTTTSTPSSSSSAAPEATKKSKVIDKKVASAPASPSPERTFYIDDDDQPVVIPTERRLSDDADVMVISPNSSGKSKEHTPRSQDHDHRHRQHHKDQQHCKDSPKYEEHRKLPDTKQPNPRNVGEKDKSDCQASHMAQHRATLNVHHHSPSDRNSPLSHHRISKDLHNHALSKHQQQQQQSSVKKETSLLPPKSNLSPMVQTVKVVITEPLPENIAKRHFPPHHQYRYQQSQNSSPSRDQQRCLNNIEIKTTETNHLPERRPINEEAYNPDECWEKYNEAHKNSKNLSTKTVFHRLGDKVVTATADVAESSIKTSPIPIPNPSTSLPEVLKSPPLSVTDINNLLKESGAEQVSSDISAIGSRRTKKPESNDSKNSLDYVRKKFAQIAKINSPQMKESTAPTVEIKSEEKSTTAASAPSERLALKYNPHPRQERLQSLSSNDGSECSQQSATRLNTNDPRLKLKMQGNTALPPVGVNVLPSINVNDPRLKRQAPLSTTDSCHSQFGMASSLPTSAMPTPSLVNNYARKDPRIARQLSVPVQSPVRRLSTSQTYISPEQNWETDLEDHINKNDPRNSRGTQRQLLSTSLERPTLVTPPIHRKTIGQTRELPGTLLDTYTPNPPQGDSEENWDTETDALSISTVVKESTLTTTAINKSDPRLSRDMPRQPQQIRRKSISQTRDVASAPIDQLFTPNVPTHDMERIWDSKASVNPSLSNNNIMSRSSMFVPFGVQPPHPPYLANPYGKMPLLPNSTPPPLIPFSTQSHFAQGSSGASPVNRFNFALNDSKERMKYFEAKHTKTKEARTYLEFKKAKERAQALEAENRKAQEEAATNRKIEETQAAKKRTAEEKPKKDSEQQEKDKAKTKPVQQNKKQLDKMAPTKIKDLAASPAGESTLDKMYRTQNFTTQFPKASISFKIPKKKSEDNPTTPTTAAVKGADKNMDEKKLRASEKSVDKIQEKINTTNNTKPKKAAGQKTLHETTTDKPAKRQFIPNPPNGDDTEENWDTEIEPESDHTIEPTGKSISSRDPRCRPKDIHDALDKVHDKVSEIPKAVKDAVEGGSNESKASLKLAEGASNESKASVNLATNTKKFLDDQILHTFSPNTEFKPQRILRRRCTMVSIGSAPLVDKDKLLKANALMLEDIEERDKLKRKKEEEERQAARRNKQLAEMFQKTDDNCSVSTQNIITGKRRTRPSINFNETQNAINVFKHLSVSKKDALSPVTPPTQAATGKTARARSKQKAGEENARSNEKPEEPAKDENSTEKECRKQTDKFVDTKIEAADNEKSSEKMEKEENTENTSAVKKNVDEKDNRKDEDTKENLNEKQKAEVESSAPIENAKENVADSDEDAPTHKTACKKAKKGGKAPVANVKPTKDSNKPTKSIPHIDGDEKPTTSKASTASEEHQNCIVSSSTSAEMPSEANTSTSTTVISSLKEEVDDNEPSSTGSKSSNPTPTPPEDESSRHAFLNEFVQEIIKPNADKQHILSLLGQILSEDKLQIIKTVIDSTIKETDEEKDDDDSTKLNDSNAESKANIKEYKEEKSVKREEESAAEDDDEDHEGDEDHEAFPSTSLKTSKAGRRRHIAKKKRNELERLNDDIRDMFICQGVLTASGKRMCTLMSQTTAKKDAESPPNKRSTSASNRSELDTSAKRKVVATKVAKPMAQPLRRSLRGCKTTEVPFDNNNDDDIASGDLTEDSNTTVDITPTRRKMPVLKPHTPIKLPEEAEVKNLNKDSNVKRKPPNKPCPKSKKSKPDKDSGKESESESGSVTADSDDEVVASTYINNIKNTNVHWHNQSKYTSWCMLCNKKIHSMPSSFHYKMHHGENYISRLTPVQLQEFKQGKLCQPHFGVDRTPKQSSWFHRCPFCLQYFNTALPLWLEHFQNHTAEFRYECSKCHWGSNRVATTRRHISTTRRDVDRNCKGATVVNSVVKLADPAVIKAHVCHLCNFIQLKRANLERHYREQHQLGTKNVDLLGYTITLFDYTDVKRVPEAKAQAKEEEVRQLIAKDEKIVDVLDNDDDDIDGNGNESEKKEDNEEVKKVNKQNNIKMERNYNQTEKDELVISIKNTSTKITPDAVEKIDVRREEPQSKKDTVTDVPSENTDKENRASKALSQEDEPPKTIETKSKNVDSKVTKTIRHQSPIENKIDEVCDESIPSAEVTTHKTEPTTPAKKVPMTMGIPQKVTTPIKTPDTVATAPKIATPVKLPITTPPKAQIAIAKGTVRKEGNLTQKEPKQMMTEKAKPTEGGDECDLSMSVNENKITLANKPSTSKNKSEGVDDLKNNIPTNNKISNSAMKANENPTTSITATAPTVQIAARKYTLVFSGKNEPSLQDVSDKANKTHPTFNCQIINKDVDAKEVQDELLSLAAQAAEEQEGEEMTDERNNKTDMQVLPDVVQNKLDVPGEQNVPCEQDIPDEKDVQNVQDELLSLAAQAAEDQEKEECMERKKNVVETKLITDTISTVALYQNPTTSGNGTKMSDLISGSIDMIFQRNKRKSDDNEEPNGIPKKHCPSNLNQLSATSNIFVPSRLGTSSPPIQILAQSIVNVEAQDKVLETSHKPVTTSIAERLSQRFKVLQEKAKSLKESKELVNQNECRTEESKPVTGIIDIAKTKESGKAIPPTTDEVTVISDDEDWEDIEITETAPNTGSYNSNNLQKAKNKGLFQKFGLFKANTGKGKKHSAPLAFMPKKKITKEKSSHQHSTSSSPIPTKLANADKSISPAVHLGFKPVINIMEDLLPDSPCNDPIDLVPELTPLEPLTDLNDISSILDSNLSGAMDSVSLHIDESHTCIQDALDFISEQTAHEHQSQKTLAPAGQVQTKSHTNKVQNVGYSLQSQKENSIKFYCLLEKCSFLFSSDAMGLENHFLCEHAQIKWKGYCMLCQSQCFPNDQDYSISKEIKHMVDKHVNRPIIEPNSDSSQHSATAGQGGEERPRIKLRRMTGDCLSTSNSESPTPSSSSAPQSANATATTVQANTLLGALLNAKPMPPTKEMPPQPEMPLTEPLLIDNSVIDPPSSSFTNVSNDFVITSVTSGEQARSLSDKPFQIASVVSLNQQQEQLPKISNVCTLSSKAGRIWSQHIEDERQELLDSVATSLEVSAILANARNPSYRREPSQRSQDDSPGPVVVAETVPVGQAKAGDFVITQTVSAQYGDDVAAAVGFNISIESSALANIGEVSNSMHNVQTPQTTGGARVPALIRSDSDHPRVVADSVPAQLHNLPLNATAVEEKTPPITSRNYKCMANGCKFTTRVPVAMSDHLRFHERRNLSLKCDYLDCAFCSYKADDVDDYMKHSDQFHIIGKGNKPTTSENDVPPLAPMSSINICDILSKKMETNANRNSGSTAEIQRSLIVKQKESDEEYLKKLRATIDEIVGPTGFPDDKLYRCVIKNCCTQLTEATFHNHILYHISTLGISNPNNYIFKCPHCTAQYHRPAGIKAHIKNHARNRYFCYLCEVTSANPGQMLKHFSDKHWHTLNMYTKELLKPKVISVADGKQVQDSCYYLTYTTELSDDDVRKYGEKLILEWQRKKSGSKTHFKSSEIDLLPIQPIFQREANCGECEYKTKVRTNMYRHLLMHKQYAQLPNSKGQTAVVASVDPVNPVPCLNSSERFFDKMTNLASSSLVPSSNSSSTASKNAFKPARVFVAQSDRFKCGMPDCNYITISESIFQSHLSTLHGSALSYRCPFCQEDICKRGMSVDRVLNHLRFHSSTLYRCEECNYTHYLRYVVERHINEKHATMKVNVVRHERTTENAEGAMTTTTFAGKNFKENPEANQSPSSTSTSSTSNSIPATRSSTATDVTTKSSNSSSSSGNAKSKAKWVCDICKHKVSTLAQIQMHCQNSHGQNKPYQCMHCQFGSQQLSQILFHIDEIHPDKTRNARYIYHKMDNDEELDVAETRPLWQRNDPTRIRHIRGILMEDEEESEKYRKKLGLDKAFDDEDDNDGNDEEDDATDVLSHNFVKGYEFGCFHCDFNSERFDELHCKHYKNAHSSPVEGKKPFIFRLLRRVCCPECRKFTGNFYQMQLHLLNTHNIRNYYAADITLAETEDNSQRLVCGYCSFHCLKSEHLMKHFQSAKSAHSPQDVRIESHVQMLDILKLGTTQTYYQCSLCSQIFAGRDVIVHHAVNFHANDEGFSFKEHTNTVIYCCALCSFSSTTESTLLRHMIDHYGGFKRCHFCYSKQISFEHYMQHCYEEHREDIHNFRDLYPYNDISNFLLQMCILFPNGLMLSKKNLLKTRYGSDTAIQLFYEEMYKISQQPPIPRLWIARLVARKSIEAHHRQTSASSSPQHVVEVITDEVGTTSTPTPSTSQAKKITKRRCTVAMGQEEDNGRSITPTPNKIRKSTTDSSITSDARKRNPLLVVEPETSSNQSSEFNVPLAHSMNIKKRRRTVASDQNEKSPSPFSRHNSPQLFVTQEDGVKGKKPKNEDATSAQSISPAPSSKEMSPSDLEYYSYYGIKPEPLDLSKIYTKVAIGGINTPLTVDKFRLLFNIDCQLKLTKCDVSHVPVYTQYKHIKKACPASHKLRFS